MSREKLHVFVLLTWPKKGDVRIEGVYSSRTGAVLKQAKLDKIKKEERSILDMAVQGSKAIHPGFTNAVYARLY